MRRDTGDGSAALGFSNCREVTDGRHIPVLSPAHRAAGYSYRKGNFLWLRKCGGITGLLQCSVADWSGNVHDTHIFNNTGWFRKLQAGTFFPSWQITIGSVEMPVVIQGDPAYPWFPWLMKPYTGHLDSAKERLNYRLSGCKVRVVWDTGSFYSLGQISVRKTSHWLQLPVVSCMVSVRPGGWGVAAGVEVALNEAAPVISPFITLALCSLELRVYVALVAH